jgi:hypothetical protein
MIRSLVRAWFGLYLLCLGAVLLQPSTPATVLGRYSTTSALILGALLVLTPVAWWGTRWLSQRIEQRQATRAGVVAVLAACGVMLAALWLPNVGVTSSYIIIRLCLTVVAFTIALWALDGLGLPTWAALLGAATGVASVVVLLLAAPRFPGLLWTDEGYMVTMAMGFTRTGHLTTLFWQPAQLESFSLSYVALSEWFGLFGVGLETGRLFVFTVALGALLFGFLTARIVYSPRAAWAVIVLGGVAFLFLNYLRQDAEVALFLGIAFYCFALAERTGRNWLHFLVGLALGLSLDGHPNAYRFCLAFGAAYLLEYALLLRERRRFTLYWPLIGLMAGGVLGVGAYVLFYSKVTVNFGSFASGGPLFSLHLADSPAVLLDQFNQALRATPLLLGAAAVGGVAAWRRHTRFDRLLLVVVTGSVLIIATLYGYTRVYYLVHLVIPLALLGAGAFHEIDLRFGAAATGVVTALLGLASVTLLVGGLRGEQGYNQALVIADRLRKIVPKDAVFVGIDPFYLRMADYPHFVELNAAEWTAKQKDISVRDAWELVGANAVAIVRDYPKPTPPELMDYIHAHGLALAHCWQGDQIGRVDLYLSDDSLSASACEPVEGS